MLSPLTRILIKIFVIGFYQVHSGMLTFFFVTIFLYCVFINVLNRTHLSHEQIVLHNLKVVLAFISSPIIALLVCIMLLAYTIKSWKYVLGQILLPNNLFLFYSGTSIHKVDQFKSWFLVQVMISLPIMGYVLFSLVIGFFFGHYAIPLVMLWSILLVVSTSAWIYVKYSNRLIEATTNSILLRVTGNWVKPLFTLVLYHIFYRLSISLIITKILSATIIVGGLYLLADSHGKVDVAGIITLGIAVAHTFLIYQSYRFENSYLLFSRNFPHGRSKVYFSWAMTYLVLTLPENIWFFANFHPGLAIALLFFNLGAGMLFHSLLYRVARDMRKLLYWIFGLFNLFFFMILLDMFWVLVPLNLFVSYTIFYGSYYRQGSLIRL